MQAILMIVGLGGGVNACADMPRKGALPRGVRLSHRTSAISPRFRAFDWPRGSASDREGQFPRFRFRRLWVSIFRGISKLLSARKKRTFDRKRVNPKSRFEKSRMRKGRCSDDNTETTTAAFRRRARRLAERARAISKHDDGPSQCSSRDSAAERPARHHRRLRGESRRREPSLPVPRKSDSQSRVAVTRQKARRRSEHHAWRRGTRTTRPRRASRGSPVPRRSGTRSWTAWPPTRWMRGRVTPSRGTSVRRSR